MTRDFYKLYYEKTLKEVTIMLKLERNVGQIQQFTPEESKYLLHTKCDGIDVYAKPGVWPVIGYCLHRIMNFKEYIVDKLSVWFAE